MASFTTLKSASLLLALLSLQQISSTEGHRGEDYGPQATHSLLTKDLVFVKVWCLIIFFVISFGCGVSPYLLRRKQSFLLLGTQFAGGAFVATALLHFLEASTSTLYRRTEIMSLSFILASVGYAVSVLFDSIVSCATKSRVTETEPKFELEEGRRAGEEQAGLDVNQASVRPSSFWDTLLLLLAWCFHSVFDGIAVGLAANERSAWRGMWQISLHRIFVGIAMGITVLRLVQKRQLPAIIAYSLAFAGSSAVGVGIGIAINATYEGSAANTIYGISTALAAGVFIHVGITHLIARGFRPHTPSRFNSPFYKFIALLLGMAVAGVSLLFA